MQLLTGEMYQSISSVTNSIDLGTGVIVQGIRNEQVKQSINGTK
jgi:hypothetical protein